MPSHPNSEQANTRDHPSLSDIVTVMNLPEPQAKTHYERETAAVPCEQENRKRKKKQRKAMQ